jgi:hypothetical protein
MLIFVADDEILARVMKESMEDHLKHTNSSALKSKIRLTFINRKIIKTSARITIPLLVIKRKLLSFQNSWTDFARVK